MKKELTGTWFSEDNEPIIIKGIAQRDIEVGEILHTYDRFIILKLLKKRIKQMKGGKK